MKKYSLGIITIAFALSIGMAASHAQTLDELELMLTEEDCTAGDLSACNTAAMLLQDPEMAALYRDVVQPLMDAFEPIVIDQIAMLMMMPD